jgi:hypothetical protein
MMSDPTGNQQKPQLDDWPLEDSVELQRLLDQGMGLRLIATKLGRSQKSIKQKAKDIRISLAANGGNYVFGFYLFTSRRGDAPTPWTWEIRRKGRPNEPFLSEKGFRSAKAAEESGNVILEDLRHQTRIKLVQEELVAALNATPKAMKPQRQRLTPEQRSENARKAAIARAQKLTPERRLEIARLGGSVAKEKAKAARITKASRGS